MSDDETRRHLPAIPKPIDLAGLTEQGPFAGHGWPPWEELAAANPYPAEGERFDRTISWEPWRSSPLARLW